MIFYPSDLLPSVLASARLFQGVNLASVAAELRESREQTLESGQVLLDPKHLNTHIYIVLGGELQVCLEPRISNPLVRLGAGGCVGELSIIDASTPSAVVASGPT